VILGMSQKIWDLCYRYEKAIICLGLFSLFLVGHFALNDLADVRPRRYLPLLFGEQIPFVPAFIVVYLSSFVLVFVPAFVIRDGVAFRRTAGGFLVAILVSFAFFLAFPLTVERVESPEGNSLLVELLRWFQSVAKPHNTFPSLHVALCTLAAVSVLAHARRVGIVMCIYAALVAVSTLFLKLHNVLDLVAGLVLVAAVWTWVVKGGQARKT
jgi:membrane-associated phospholipid phosphatase